MELELEVEQETTFDNKLLEICHVIKFENNQINLLKMKIKSQMEDINLTLDEINKHTNNIEFFVNAQIKIKEKK